MDFKEKAPEKKANTTKKQKPSRKSNINTKQIQSEQNFDQEAMQVTEIDRNTSDNFAQGYSKYFPMQKKTTKTYLSTKFPNTMLCTTKNYIYLTDCYIQ